MFSKETYIRRRAELKKLVGQGIIVLFGNNEAPCNYPANAYAPMRQDSTFLYYFGQHRDGLVGVIDIDNDEEWLFGDDIDVEDIVWMGFTPSVSDLAAEVGVTKTAPLSKLRQVCCDSTSQKRQTIHFLPPYRHDTKIQIMDLLGIHPSKQKEAASLPLIKAVVKMRATKEPRGDCLYRGRLRRGLRHAHHRPDAHQARRHRALRGRTGGRHRPLAGTGQQLCHHLLAARRDHARLTVGRSARGRPPGALRCRLRTERLLL